MLGFCTTFSYSSNIADNNYPESFEQWQSAKYSNLKKMLFGTWIALIFKTFEVGKLWQSAK